MTKETMEIDSQGRIYFDCRMHAGVKDVCIMISTLCNVLIVACKEYGIDPVIDDDGHLAFDIKHAPYPLMQVFQWVQMVFNEIQSQFPDNLSVY